MTSAIHDEQREQWLPAPFSFFADRYEVSSFGRIRSLYSAYGKRQIPRLLKQFRNPNGYFQVTLGKDKSRRTFWVHRLVIQAFNPTHSPTLVCSHLDGDQMNNHTSNLAWMTQAENLALKHIHGTAQFGELHPRSKLSAADVQAIKIAATHYNQREIAATFDVSQTQISRILRGENWNKSGDAECKH